MIDRQMSESRAHKKLKLIFDNGAMHSSKGGAAISLRGKDRDCHLARTRAALFSTGPFARNLYAQVSRGSLWASPSERTNSRQSGPLHGGILGKVEGAAERPAAMNIIMREFFFPFEQGLAILVFPGP